MRGVQVLGLACAVLLSASLLLARVHPLGDAGLFSTHPSSPLMEDAHVPPQVRSILASKCANCHSAQTRAPIYGRFAPVSWLMESDIVRGRKAMNLNQWSTYSEDKRANLSQEIVEMTRKGKMPLLQYRLIHWNARINSTDLAALTNWAQATSAASSTPSSGEASAGHVLFDKRCSGCHSLAHDGEGPRLGGVFGRTSGTATGYQYSDALKKAHIVWDETTLDKWLTDPDKLAPGTEMDFSVSKPEERQQIIRYLQSAM